MIISDEKVECGKCVQVYPGVEDSFTSACFGDVPVSVLSNAQFYIDGKLCDYSQAKAALCDWQTVYFA